MKCALVVDEDAKLRGLVAKILVDCGFDRVVEAANTTLGAALAASEKPLLTVLDLSLSGAAGITAAEKIGSLTAGPIVLLAGAGESDCLEKAWELGVSQLLMKPFAEEQLKVTIDTAIHQFVEMSSLQQEVDKLRETLETRKKIDRAKGALMRQGLSEPDAYRKMQKLAMDKRKSLKEVAEAILLMEG
jgi:response regulator NasT